MIQKKNEFILITCSNFPEGGATANYLNLFCKGLLLNNQSISVWLLKGFGFGNQTNQDKKKNFTKEGILFTYLSSPRRPKSKFKKIYDDCISIIVLSIYLSKLILTKKKITLISL